MRLLVETIYPAKNKAGEEIKGSGKRGAWQLYKINKKYSYFHNGEEELGITEGVEYDFDLNTEVKGEYTNCTLTLVGEGEVRTADTGNALIMEEIAKVNERLDKLIKYLTNDNPDR